MPMITIYQTADILSTVLTNKMINLKVRIIMLFDKFSGLNTDYDGLQPGVVFMVGMEWFRNQT